jgi:hypothetical protein
MSIHKYCNQSTDLTTSSFITVIQSLQPSKVCKTFFINDESELDKKAIANVSKGKATTVDVRTAHNFIDLLQEVTESTNKVICSGRWHNANEDEEFEIMPEEELCKLLGAKKGDVSGGVVEHNGRKVSARLKRGITDSNWILLDADNPPGIPNEWAKMNIADRLKLWESFLPGICQCERIELRGSSARVSNNGVFGEASHAWIRISHPEKLSLLKAHIRVQMELHDAVFEFKKLSRKEPGKILGIEPRSVFDLAVLDTGRLTFCAKPEVRAEGYEVADAAISLINEGGGALDISAIHAPSQSDIAKLNNNSESRLQFSIGTNGQVKTVEEGKLKLSTEIESRGTVKTLKDWIDGVGENFHLRCESPFRESCSEAAFIGTDNSGIPFVFDIGNSTTYYLGDGERAELIFSGIEKVGYRPDFRPSERFNDVVTDYVYLEEEDKYYRPYDGAILKPAAINNEFLGKYFIVNAKGDKATQSAVHYFHDNHERRRAKGMGWHPVDQLFFNSGKANLVNTFEGLAVTPLEGDVSLWLSLVSHVYGQYADLFLDHLAFSLQHPEKKINWQVLTIGAPRTGKSMSMRPIKRIWGSACQVIDPDMMGTGWGDLYAQKKIIVVEEVWRAGEKKFFNSIKPGLVNDDPELLNMKGRGMIRQLNLRAYYMFSNHEDALSFNEDEDKLLVIDAPKTPWGSQERFKELASWSDTNEGAGAVLNFLIQRDVSQFCYGKLPERTLAMVRMVELSQPDYHRAVFELSEESYGVFSRYFFTFSEVRETMRKAGYGAFGDKGLKEALRDAGYIQLSQPQKKINGHVYSLGRVWVRSDGPLQDLGTSELFTFILYYKYKQKDYFLSNIRAEPFAQVLVRAQEWSRSMTSNGLLRAFEDVIRDSL